MAVRRGGSRRRQAPLDRERLESLALAYAARFATSRARLSAYLQRKLRELGWAGDADPPVTELVERLAGLGYVDDAAFARARAEALQRRGYGGRRIEAALRAAGIDADERADIASAGAAGAWQAALRLAERRRLGPFADREPDRAGRERALATLLRAGHDFAHSRRIVDAPPGEIPELDDG